MKERRPVGCSARQHSDQMICHRCGMLWDINDPNPPPCSPRPAPTPQLQALPLKRNRFSRKRVTV